MGESARLHQPFCPSFVPLFVVEAVRATEEYKRIGWELWVRMDKTMCAMLREDLGRQAQEETTDAPSEGPETCTSDRLDLAHPKLPSVPPVKWVAGSSHRGYRG